MNMGYRLWVSRLTISKGESNVDITLNLENSGVPFYMAISLWYYTCVMLMVRVFQAQDLDCRLLNCFQIKQLNLKASFAYSKKSELSEARNSISNDTRAFCSFRNERF